MSTPVEARIVAARHALEQGRLAEAHLRRAIAIDPARRWPYCDLARLLLEAGRSAEAEIVLRQALEADPGNADALMLLTGAELQRGLLIEAEIHVLAAIARVGPCLPRLKPMRRSCRAQQRRPTCLELRAQTCTSSLEKRCAASISAPASSSGSSASAPVVITSSPSCRTRRSLSCLALSASTFSSESISRGLRIPLAPIGGDAPIARLR